MLTKQSKFLIALVIQIIIIFGLIIFKSLALIGPTIVLLKIVPVDPRDFLRGDYISFQYEISNVETPNWYTSEDMIIKNNDSVYVTLDEGLDYWYASSVTKIKPDDTVAFIKGTVVSGGGEGQMGQLINQPTPNSHLQIIYGIEQKFIPEGVGSNFSFANKEVTASVAVNKNGQAILKQIFINGEPWP